MERILVILTDEIDYAYELSAYLSSRPEFIFKPMIFNDTDEYLKYEQSNHVDMLLCSETAALAAGSSFCAENICILSECIMVAETDETEIIPGAGRIFKYQASQNIMQDIIDFYGRRHLTACENSAVGDINGQRTVVVCSPMGGSYCSTYALALAEYFSRGGRTLFISFDPFFLLPAETKHYADKNLTDVIYFLQLCKVDPAVFVEKIARHRGNLDYLSGVSHLFDIADMSPADMRSLFTSLCESGRYETMIFDLGTIGSAGVELLAGCGSVYVPKKTGGNYEAILGEWKRQMAYSGQKDIIEKVREHELPYDDLLSGAYSFDKLLKGTLGQYINESEGLGYLK